MEKLTRKFECDIRKSETVMFFFACYAISKKNRIKKCSGGMRDVFVISFHVCKGK